MSFEGLLGEGNSVLREYAEPQSSASEVLRVRGQQALETNPIARTMRSSILDEARDAGPMLSADEARARLKAAQLDTALTVPDQGISAAALEILMRRKSTERKRQDILRRSPGGLGLEAAGLAVEFGASLLDPVNVGSGFVPVVGQARYGRWLAAAGEGALGLAGRTGIRAGVGAVEGTIGAALIEPTIAAGMDAEQADYTAMDSLYNIAFGGLFGGGLHTIGGAGLDLYRYARGRPLLDAVGSAPDLSPPPSVPRGTVLGAEANVRIGDAYVPGRWAVVEADDVEATMARADNQYRDRNRAASQAQIREIAQNLDFNLLADSPVMDYGAPTLSRDGKVIGGNGRLAAIRQAYEAGTGYRYQEPLREALGRFGIDPDELAEMKRPVLVRVLGEDVDVRRAAIASNEGGALRMSALEQAKVDAERLGSLEGIEVGDAGELNRAGNRDMIRRWVGEQPTTQRAALQDADGYLSAEGLTRLRNAILYRAFGDSPTLQRLIEATDPGLRNVASALTRAAGRVAEVRDAITVGDLYDLDISPDVQAAVEKLVRLREEGMSVGDYLAQGSLLGADLTPEAIDVLRFMDRNIRSPAGMAEFLTKYYEGVVAAGNPKQADMFGGGPPTKAELLARAGDRVVPAAEVVEGLRPETREAALRTAVAQAVTGREIDVEPVVDLDPSRRTAADPVAEARAAAERADAPEQATLVDFEAARETPEPKPAAPELDEAQAALDEAMTAAKDAAKAGSEAYKYSREGGDADLFPRVDAQKLMQVGFTGFVPRVVAEGKPLYREVNESGLFDLILLDDGFHATNIFVADNPDIAIGQGTNRGIKVTLRPNSASGRENVKPGTGDIAGREYQIDALAPRAVQSVTMPAKTVGKLRGLVKVRLGRSFDRVNNGDGTVTFTRRMDATFARGDAVGATPVEQLTEAVRASFGEATDALLQAGRIQVVESADEVPGGPHPEDVRAVYAPDGTTYIVASNMPPELVRGVVLHEIGVHAGMREMLGDDLWTRTLGELDRLSAEGNAAVLRARAMVPDDTPAALVREETLAYLVQNNPELPFVRRIIAAIKAWLYRVTNGALKIGDDELVSLAQSALRRQARGAMSAGGSAMASRGRSSADQFRQLVRSSREFVEKVLSRRLKDAGEDFVIREVPLESVRLQQFGDDYANDSSRETARRIASGSVLDERPEDILPVRLDASGSLLDGHHRHAAAVMNEERTILALVPVGTGRGRVLNLDEYSSGLKGLAARVAAALEGSPVQRRAALLNYLEAFVAEKRQQAPDAFIESSYFRGSMPDTDRGHARYISKHFEELPEPVKRALGYEDVRDLETGETLNALTDDIRGGHIGQLRRVVEEDAGGVLYSRGPERADDPNAEFKPFDEAIKRAELYSKAVRAAAERLGDDDAARAAMRAATADKLGVEEIDALLDQLKAENRKVRARLRKARQQFTSEDTADVLQGDAMRAADTLANNITMDATIAKRNAALALTARTKAIGRILNEFAKDPVEGLLGLLGSSSFARQGAKDSVFHWQRTYFTRWTKGMLADLEEGGLAEAFVRNAYDRDVARALYQLGKPAPRLDGLAPEAVKIAQIVFKYREDARGTRNRFGAWIRQMSGYITRQTHDFTKIRAAGAQAWKDFVRQRLDVERTLGEHGAEDLEGVLQRLYEDFAAGRHMSTLDDEVAAMTMPGSLARRVSQSRVLYFKDADAEFDYLQTFGVGKLHEAVLGDLSRAGQQAGLLRVLGPNPEDSLRRVMDEVEESLAGDPQKRRAFYEARGKADALLSMLDGRANIPGSHIAARVSANVRVWQSLSKLGGALISAVTDLPVYASAIRYQGRGGLLSGIGEGLGNLVRGRPKGEQRQILGMIDSVADGLIGGVAARFDADDILSGNMSELMRLYFRMNGLQWWTDTLREGMELGTSSWLGSLRGRSWDKLDANAHRVLKLYSIDDAKWDVLRLAVHEASDGRAYLVPEAMQHVPDGVIRGYVERIGRTVSDAGIANARRDLGDTLRGLIIDQAMTAVIEPDVRSRYFWTRGTRPGTVPGEVLRFISQFKGFPTALTRQVFGREIFGRGYDTLGDYLKNGKGDMLGLAQLILAMTAFGYVAMTAKDALKGRMPRDPTSPAVWAAAMMQGGALGIYGDFLLGQSNRFGRNILDTMAGPVFGLAGDVDDLRQRIMRGDDVASSAFRLAVNNTPFLNLFYVRTAMDYLLLYQIQEALNPGSVRRMERRVRQENAQEFWLPPSQAVN